MRVQDLSPLACLLALLSLPLHAASIAVTTTTDEDTANALCSLREAVIAANTDANYNGCVRFNDGNGSNDTIVVPAGTYLLTLTGTNEDAALTGDLDILPAGTLTIQGAGRDVTVIDGNNADRVFDVHAADLTLAGLTVQHGDAGIFQGGGIRVISGTLLFRDGAVRNNHAHSGGGLGIFGTNPNVTLSRLVVSGNSSTIPGDFGGGMFVLASGLGTTGTFLIEDSAFVANQTDDQAGALALQANGATLNTTIRRVTFSGNTAAAGNARGLFVVGDASSTINLGLSNVILADGGIEYAQSALGSLNLVRNVTLASDATLPIAGTGNLNNADPLFVDAANGNLQLQAGSPALNVGDNTGIAPGALDLAGNPRIVNGIVDLGAYERQYVTVTPLAVSNGSVAPPAAFQVQVNTPASLNVTPATGYSAATAVTGTCPAGSWSSNTYSTAAVTADCTVGLSFTLNNYPITVNAGAGGSALCTPNPVDHGTTTGCTVTSLPGYTTSSTAGGDCPAGSWSGNIWTTGAITAACSVDFTFTLNSYPVTIDAGPGGSALCTPNPVDHGTTTGCTVTSLPGYTTGSTVSGNCPAGSWSGNTWTTGAITAACSVGFAFTLNSYPVTVNAGAGGSAVCSPNPVDHGTTTSCAVSASTGYTAAAAVGGDCPAGSWSGNTWTTGPITAACTVGFAFNISSYTITASANPGPGGTAICTPAVVSHGGSSTCTASANPGYLFSGWSGDCTGTSCTLTNITAARSVVANFTALAVPTLSGWAVVLLCGMMLGLTALGRGRPG